MTLENVRSLARPATLLTVGTGGQEHRHGQALVGCVSMGKGDGEPLALTLSVGM